MPNISHTAMDSKLHYRGKGQWTMACEFTDWLFLSQTSVCCGLLITTETPCLTSNLVCSKLPPPAPSTQYCSLITVNLRPHPHIVPPHSAPRYQNMGWNQPRQAAAGCKGSKYYFPPIKMCISLWACSTQNSGTNICPPSSTFVVWQPCSVHGTEEACSKVCWIVELGLRSLKDNCI